MPATSSNVTPISSWAYILPRLRPNDIGEPAPFKRRMAIIKIVIMMIITIAIGTYWL